MKRLTQSLLKVTLILTLLLSPIFSAPVYAQTEDKVVTITDPLDPAKALTYSGTYVYQGTRASYDGSSGGIKIRAYYKCGSNYLYADYLNGRDDFPNGFEWVIRAGSIESRIQTFVYQGWENSDMNYPSSTGPSWNWWWGDMSGNEVTVTVSNAVSGVAPSVSTLEASLVTNTSGTMGGNVTADGGATTDRGFVYSSTDATPTIGEPGVTQITKGTGTGVYTEVVSGLTAGVTYYYQAYGHNTYGTTYGTVKSFTTPTTSAPNKIVSNAGGANGIYVWIGEYYGKPAWKHETLNYWLYYSKYGMAYPTDHYWYIDDELKDEHGAEDFNYDHLDAATCPSSGWRWPDNSAASVTIADYPQVDFTHGAAYSPGNPTGGTTNNPIGRFFLDADTAGASLTAVTINAAGTRSGITNLKLWSSTDATFNAGSDTQLNSQSDGATVTFSGFSSAISASGTYYFITTDLGASAAGAFTLTIGSKANLTISGGASSTVFTNAPLTSGAITIIPAIEINITGNGTTINDGDATPSSTDHTDFGNADIVTGSVVRTFTIQSTSAGTVSLTAPSPYVAIAGATTDFSLTQTPSGSIAGGSSTTFQITFNPTTTGTRSATVSIANNDGDEDPYNFSIKGTGTSAPEMDVLGNSTSIADGDATPSGTDETEFGNVSVTTGSVEHTFTIANTGSGALGLTGSSPYVSISGATSDFSLTQTPESSIAAGGGTTTFRITFNPTVAGTRSAVISIANDDSDENPYNFSIQGTGITTPTLTTAAAASVGTTAATLGGNVSSDGGVSVTDRGVVYSSTDATPTIGEGGVTQNSNGSGTGAFSESIGSLSLATHYYYQAYATNSEGTSYGGVVEFTTQNQISSIARSGSDPTNASSVSWEVEFSATVTGLTSSNFTLANTGLTGPAITDVSGSGTEWTVTANTGIGSGTLGLNLTSNAGLNAELSNIPFTGQVFTVDKAAPAVTINQAVGQADPTNTGPISFTVVFSEPVTGFATGDVDLSASTASGTLTGTVSETGPMNGTTYNVAVSGMTGDGVVIAAIAANKAQDAAGNGNVASTSTDNSVTYDITAPTVTINQAVEQSDPTHTGPISFTVVFSEAVTGFATGDVTLSASTAPGTLVGTVTGGPITYTVAVSGMTGNGVITASILAGVANDVAGNPNTASTSTDNAVTFDNTPPPAPVVVTPANGSRTNDATPTVSGTAEANSTVTVFFDGASAGTTTANGSGNWSFTPGSALSAAAHTVRATATDAAGNTSVNSNTNTFTIDTTAPTVTINQAVGQADPSGVSPISFTVVFSEPVTGFATGDVNLSASTTPGTLTGIVSEIGPMDGTTYNVAVSGMTGDGVVIAAIAANKALDAAGNNNTASTSTDNSVTYDTTAPMVTINQAVGQVDPTHTGPISFTVIFSEIVTGFGDDDVDLSSSTTPGTLVGTVTGGPITYTVAVSGMTGNGVITASILAGEANDLAGNPNTASTSTDNAVTYDATAPMVTINQAVGQADPTNIGPISFTVVFSEPVIGFATGDVDLSAGTAPGTLVGTVTGGPVTYTVAVSGMTGDGTVLASLPAGAATDAAGNGNATSTSTDNSVLYDVTAPDTSILSHPSNPTTSTSGSFSFSGNDGSGSGIASFECDLDGGGFNTCPSPRDYSSLSLGSHTFQVRAIDNVGYVDATPASFTWVVNQAPAITSANTTTFVIGSAGTFAVTTTGFPTGASMAISETGSLPSGVTFTDNHDGTATLAGTPAAGTDGTYPITITANNGVTPNATQSFTLTVNRVYKVYLPLVMRNAAFAPDLVVQSVQVAGNSAQVVIRNQGNAPVKDEFYVDLYVNPNPVPTGVNQIWSDGRSAQGIVWGVAASALPALQPGGVLTLTLGDAYYLPDMSSFTGSLPVGTPVYVQVDSANAGVSYGAVRETHEIIGLTYNNISGPVLALAVAPRQVELVPPVAQQPPSTQLPPRS